MKPCHKKYRYGHVHLLKPNQSGMYKVLSKLTGCLPN